MKTTETTTSQLLSWYYQNARELPWRFHQRDKTITKDITLIGYKILVSEFMLQQTTVTSVLKYYTKFLQVYPTIDSLAQASQEDVLKHWSGLGYYSRARNLHLCAIALMQDYNGIIPDSFKTLLTLPGVGQYTAGALYTLVHDKKAPAIDANVRRVISRILCLHHEITHHEKKFETWALKHSPNNHCGDFTQALIELGACICKPTSPNCPSCPLKSVCFAYNNNRVSDFPLKKKKKKPPNRYAITYIVETQNKEILLTKRPEKGLLANMRETPMSDFLLDKTSILSFESQFLKTKTLKHNLKEPLCNVNTLQPAFLRNLSGWKKIQSSVKHIFTHFVLEVDIVYIHLKQKIDTENYNGIWVKKTEIYDQALSTLIKKILKTYLKDA